MSNQTPKLSPCPHCGTAAAIGKGELNGDEMFLVGCNNCQAGFADEDSAMAIARWNARVITPETVELAKSEGAQVERAEMSFEDAMKFVSAWLWNNGEAEMWPAANVRDAARIVQAFANKDIDKLSEQSLAQAEGETK